MKWAYTETDKIVNTYVVNEFGEKLFIPDINSNSYPGMTEVVSLSETKALGWTASFGCGVQPYPYTAPEGWICDTAITEIRDNRLGTHGGCSNCVMILLATKVKPKFEYDLQVLLGLINPCDVVVCNDIYINKDLWSQKCDDGNCIQDQLLEKYIDEEEKTNMMTKYVIIGGVGIGLLLLLRNK